MFTFTGSCPATDEDVPLITNPQDCMMDYVGCRFDSECSGDQKCCSSAGCGYSECKSPKPLQDVSFIHLFTFKCLLF